MMTSGSDLTINLRDKEVFVYRKPYTILEAYQVINLDGFLCVTTTGDALYLSNFQVDKILEKE